MMDTFDSKHRLSRWIWVAAQALLWSLFAALFTVPFRWFLAGSLPPIREIIDVAVSFTLGLSPFFVLGIWCMNQARQFRKKLELWTQLVIDD
jgi:hypothetical protein